MYRCFVLFVCLMFALKVEMTMAQTVSYSGNLVRISMSSQAASLSDTLGSWIDYKDRYSMRQSCYYEHFKLPLHSFFLKKNTNFFDSPYMQQYGGANVIEIEGQTTARPFSATGAGWDVIPPYFQETTEITPASSGNWLSNGSLGNAFIFNNDTLRILNAPHIRYSQSLVENIYKIMGRVGNSYLGAFKTEEERWSSVEYRLVDLSDSPNLIKENSKIVRFYGPDTNSLFFQVRPVKNDLHIVQRGLPGVHFYRFSDTSFYYVKSQLNGYGNEVYLGMYAKWEFRNNKFYYFSGSELISYDFNSVDTTLINRKVLLKGDLYGDSIAVDRNFKYAALITDGLLKIYDIDKADFINSISLAGVKRPLMPFIDSPYVYVHQTTYTYTGVEDKNKTVVNGYNLSAYPNPFNPVTTIEFDIPAAGRVELKIYDALGKEVSTLLNGEVKAGKHKLQFNASSLPSGIYLCHLNAGRHNVTKKVVLIK